MSKLWQERMGLMYSYRSAWAELNVLVLNFVGYLFQNLESVWLRLRTEILLVENGKFVSQARGAWVAENHRKIRARLNPPDVHVYLLPQTRRHRAWWVSPNWGYPLKQQLKWGKLRSTIFWQNPNVSQLGIPATCSLSCSKNGTWYEKASICSYNYVHWYDTHLTHLYI